MTFNRETARAAGLKSNALRLARKQAIAAAPAAMVAEPLKADHRTRGIDWWKDPIPDCELELQKLRDAWQAASNILGARQAQLPRKKWYCAVCGAVMEDGQWKFKDDSRRDPQTGLVSPAVVCSITCYSKYWADRPRSGPRR